VFVSHRIAHARAPLRVCCNIQHPSELPLQIGAVQYSPYRNNYSIASAFAPAARNLPE